MPTRSNGDKPSWLTDPHPSIDDRQAGQRGLKLVLRGLRALIPSERLQTMAYLGLVSTPRKVLRRALLGFYRIDHVYDVLREFSRDYKGPFSVLEFGTAQGYAFAKLLYATRYLKLEDQITVHGFDSFEGLPLTQNPEDRGIMGNRWMEGAYRASYDILRDYCEGKGYRNYALHAGYFENTLTPDLLETLRQQPPILVWLDCDLYSSTRSVMERLMPVLPNGSVIYFDDLDFNFASRFTGQARFVHEVNSGTFGPDLELVLDRTLSWDSARVYRFIRFGDDAITLQRKHQREIPPQARPITGGSPLP